MGDIAFDLEFFFKYPLSRVIWMRLNKQEFSIERFAYCKLIYDLCIADLCFR